MSLEDILYTLEKKYKRLKQMYKNMNKDNYDLIMIEKNEINKNILKIYRENNFNNIPNQNDFG